MINTKPEAATAKLLSPPFQYLERLFSRNSPFSKGAQAYFAFLEREKENEHEDFLQIFLKKVQKPVLRYRAQSKKTIIMIMV